MSENTKNIFAIEADDSALQTKQGGSFGLNASSHVTTFEFEEGVSKRDDSPYKAVNIVYQVGDKEYKSAFFLNESVFSGGNDRKLLSPGDEGYDDAYYNSYVQVIAVIKHTLGALGVTKATINAALVGITGSQLIEGIQKLVALVPAGFQKIPVDFFLEYQWQISEGQDRTYLTTPKNMKGGEFVVPAVKPAGKWTEVRDAEEGLSYIDDNGTKHPFTRNSGYMESNKAKQQGVGAPKTAEQAAQEPAQAAAKSTWES